MNVAVNPKTCVGHGLCYVHAPNVFADDDQGYAQVVGDGAVAPSEEEAARITIANCPERAVVDQT